MAAAVAAAGALVAGALVLHPEADEGPAAPPHAEEPHLALPDPVRPAFTVATPPPLDGRRASSLWAPVLRAVVARAGPSADSRPLGRMTPETPEGTTNIVLVLGWTEDERGRLWARVRLAILPNNSVGWVPRDAIGGYVPVRTHLVVDLERLAATLYARGRAVFRASIGVGKPASPTPRGHFYVRNRLTTYRSPFYGPVAFGTSARSAVLTDWPAGGFVGIHGTNRPELLPGRVSHGCIRLRNADLVRLARLMPVGTPITIR